MTTEKNKTIFEEAEQLINGKRREEYGPVLESFTHIANLWSQVLNIDITPQQVAQCMIAFKLHRECNKHKRDNLVDICGYTRLLGMLENE